jgi:hypothetical protein
MSASEALTQAPVRYVVDCDVHCPVPSVDALAPYLPKHWTDYLREVEFKQLVGVNSTYPAWSEMLAPSRGQSIEQLTADVLERTDIAILNVYYGLESQQHPYLVQALATAVNRWLETEWLAKDDRLLASVVVAPLTRSVVPPRPDASSRCCCRPARGSRTGASATGPSGKPPPKRA